MLKGGTLKRGGKTMFKQLQNHQKDQQKHFSIHVLLFLNRGFLACKLQTLHGETISKKKNHMFPQMFQETKAGVCHWCTALAF